MSATASIPEKPTELELQRMIRCLRPDAELFSGRIFFEKLLNYKGVDGVLDFIERSKKALVTQVGELDLHYNFDAVEREVFKKTYLKVWSRREFLNTAGWGVPGTIFTTYGLAGLAEQKDDLQQRGTVMPEGWASMRGPKKFKEAVVAVAEPAAEVLVGAALVNEAFEKWSELKLEQIADAVDVLGKQLQVQMQIEAAAR